MPHNWNEQADSDKLTRILQLIEGDDNNPGHSGRIRMLEVVIFGEKGSPGLLAKTMIMWRLHIWILCSLSAGVGFAAREAVKLIWHI